MTGKRCSAKVLFSNKNYVVNIHTYAITTCNLTLALSALTSTIQAQTHSAYMYRYNYYKRRR